MSYQKKMDKFIKDCFVLVAKWFKALREIITGDKRRYHRKLARVRQCGSFHVVESEGVKVVKGKGLSLAHVFDGKAVFTIEGIFKKEEYNFEIGASAVVIDIGMNFGFASLYFAIRDEVKAVYSFEPFKPTFEKALFNLKINEKYACKIHPYNFGLGDSDKELSLEYYPRNPGRMSTVKTIDEIYPTRKKKTNTETVQIKKAAVEIRNIVELHHGYKIVLKCDTEGAEKEIFESLDKEGVLEFIDIILLEYHFSYDLFIEEILKRNKFAYFKQKATATGEFGMIRAIKLS